MLSPIVTELFIRGRKLNISLVFITQLILLCQKLYALFYQENFNKLELQRIAPNNSSDIDFKNFMNLYKKYTAKPYSFLVIDATLASDNLLRFRKNLSKRI